MYSGMSGSGAKSHAFLALELRSGCLDSHPALYRGGIQKVQSVHCIEDWEDGRPILDAVEEKIQNIYENRLMSAPVSVVADQYIRYMLIIVHSAKIILLRCQIGNAT
jgi:hypothetical protein